MMSVKKPETRTMRMVTVIIIAEGLPASKLPDLRASQRYAHRTGMHINSTKPTPVRSTQSAVRPLEALISATDRASRIHPTTKVQSLAARSKMLTVQLTIVSDPGG